MPRINHLPATEHHLHVSVYCVKITRVLIALPSFPARSTLSNDVSETQGWEDGITTHLSQGSTCIVPRTCLGLVVVKNREAR